jgi:hypothetical protein
VSRIDEIKSRLAAALPGPWWSGHTPFYLRMGQKDARDGTPPLTIRSPAHSEEIATVWTCLLPTRANADLIANAPQDLAWLIAEVERLSTEKS